MNVNQMFKEYGIPVLIMLVMLYLLPPYLTPMVGTTFGNFTTYVITGVTLAVSLWLTKKVRKSTD